MEIVNYVHNDYPKIDEIYSILEDLPFVIYNGLDEKSRTYLVSFVMLLSIHLYICCNDFHILDLKQKIRRITDDLNFVKCISKIIYESDISTEFCYNCIDAFYKYRQNLVINFIDDFEDCDIYLNE
jgi:hypothetical protein